LTTSPRRVALLVAVLAGLAVRVVTLTMPGTEDVMVWKTWSYGAANDLTSMYGVGGSPPVRGESSNGTRDPPPSTIRPERSTFWR
jgi:hypothetical protein